MGRKAQFVEPERPRRSDFGFFKMQDRDWDGMEFVGSMKWVRLDTLGEFWDPQHRRAIVSTSSDREQQEKKGKRGGKRTGLPWPLDATDRMSAVLRIVYRWRDHGLAKLYHPHASLPQWISLTEAGLGERELPYHEVQWPEKEKLRHDDKYYISHIHRVNQMRVRLLAGVANVPEHTWIAERVIDSRFPPRELGLARPHLADGELILTADGMWPIKIDEEVVDEVVMKRDQKIGIEAKPSIQPEVNTSSRKRIADVFASCS